MSYGSKVCPHCHGEMRVYFDGDGSSSGRCPTCDKWWNFAPMKWTPRINPKGAFYEVLLNSHLETYLGPLFKDGTGKRYDTKNLSVMESMGIYTNLEQALKRCEEIRAEAELKITETTKVLVFPYIKRWNHDRTDWEFWRPEYAELDKEVFA